MARVIFKGNRARADVRVLSKSDIVKRLEGVETNYTSTAFPRGKEVEVPDEVAAILTDASTDRLFGRFEAVNTDTQLDIPADSKATRSSK